MKKEDFSQASRSHTAALTTLIISDICGLLSFPPSCFFRSFFFNQINPDRHPLMGAFYGKLKEDDN